MSDNCYSVCSVQIVSYFRKEAKSGVSYTLSWPEVKVHHTVIANQTMTVPKVTEH